MALNLSGTSGIAGAGIGTIDASGANVTGVVTCTSVVSSGAISGTTGTFTGNLDITADNSKLRIGAAGDDFELFHDGTSNYIRSDTGNLYIESKSGQTAIQIVPDGATDLRHSGNKKFETYSGGVEVTGGTLNMDSAAMQFSGNLSLPNVGACIFRPVADTVAFGINNGQRASVNQYGLLFGTDTAEANALDDYEEGTWTPEVRIETRAASDSPIDGVDGCYTKVGKLITCHGKFVLNGTPTERSTSRAIELRGFPFDHNHDWDKISGDIRVTGHDIGSTYGDDIYFVIRMLSGLQYARIELVEQSYNGTRNASVVMQDNMYVLFSFTYQTV